MTKILISELDRIILKNSERRVVRQDDSGYVLARLGQNVDLHEHFTHDEIVKLIDAGEMSIEKNWHQESRAHARLLAGVNDISDLRDDEAEKLIRREFYVTQFLLREAADKSVKRTDECIKRVMRETFLALVDQDNRFDKSKKKEKNKCPERYPSPRALRRWLKAYESGSRDALSLRTRHRFSGNPISSLDSEIQKLVTKHAAVSYCQLSRPSVSHVYDLLKADVAELNKKRVASGLPEFICPAKATLRRKILKLNQFEVYASRHGVASARAKFVMVGTGLDVVRPLQHVQIDEFTIPLHTIANDLGLTEGISDEDLKKLKAERLKLCLVLDVASRCVLGFRISRRADAQNAIAALAMSVSDKSAIALAAGCKSDWPQRGPGSLYSPDAGGPFIDQGFRKAVTGLKAVYENAPAGISYLRGHIERIFGSIHTGLMPFFTGRAFNNVVDKGEYQAHKRASLLTTQLPQIFVRWVVDVYHHTPHEGLMGETPYNAWKRLTDQYGIAPCPNVHERRAIFGVPLERKLERRGIRVQCNDYQSDEIQEFRRLAGDVNLNIRFDPADIGHISVWFNDRWNVVPSIRESVRGVDLSTWQDAIADLRARHAAGARIYEHIVHDAIRAISGIAEDAMRRTAISAPRPSADEINRTEDNLLLGFEIVRDERSHEKPSGDILGNGIPVTSDKPIILPITSIGGEPRRKRKLED
ncbi:Mu transposase C-terminal domain-containing protein [Tardiphaga sp. 285_C5_N1_2]|uniref:Mu transposase C-terminal domain-containing protein n=1 Tax=Tardiphaga sp. 285_C5_N1_2 TaxID=3240775 RepID=UPI003F89084D